MMIWQLIASEFRRHLLSQFFGKQPWYNTTLSFISILKTELIINQDTFEPLNLAGIGEGEGADASPPMSFSEMAAEALGGSRQNFA